MKNKKLLYIFTVVIIFMGLVFGGLYWYESGTKIKIAGSKTTQLAISYMNMTQPDKDRIIKIVKGVSEDTTPATDGIRQELKELFAKYNMTDEEIGQFKLVGPGFIVPNYDTLFFLDALESLKEGIPVKSEARTYLEEFALTFKSMTPDTIKTYNQEIEKISKKEPALNPPQILTENDINGLLNYSQTILKRVDTLFSATDTQNIMDAIKQVESESPPRIGKSPTETEIHDSPYIQHIRLALNAYSNGTNTGIEMPALDATSGIDCGLNNFDKTYYKSKFIVYDASDNDYGGVQADIVFIDKPDTIFWTWVYRLGGDGEYSLRGFCKNGPSEDQKIEFKRYIDGMIKDTKYLY